MQQNGENKKTLLRADNRQKEMMLWPEAIFMLVLRFSFFAFHSKQAARNTFAVFRFAHKNSSSSSSSQRMKTCQEGQQGIQALWAIKEQFWKSSCELLWLFIFWAKLSKFVCGFCALLCFSDFLPYFLRFAALTAQQLRLTVTKSSIINCQYSKCHFTVGNCQWMQNLSKKF